MRKKSVTTLSVVLALIGVMLNERVTAISVGETSATVTIIEDESSQLPVNPEKPDETHPDGADGDGFNPPTGEKGALSLDVVPKYFDFQTQQVYQVVHTYTGVRQEKLVGGSQKQQNLHYLQVTDKRVDSEDGWTLLVSHAKSEDILQSQDYILKGAYLTIPKGVVRNSQSANPSKPAESFLSYTVEISEMAQEVLKTSADFKQTGKGQTTYSFQPEDVTLTIPKGMAKAGSYKAKVTWTLQASSLS